MYSTDIKELVFRHGVFLVTEDDMFKCSWFSYKVDGSCKVEFYVDCTKDDFSYIASQIKSKQHSLGFIAGKIVGQQQYPTDYAICIPFINIYDIHLIYATYGIKCSFKHVSCIMHKYDENEEYPAFHYFGAKRTR